MPVYTHDKQINPSIHHSYAITMIESNQGLEMKTFCEKKTLCAKLWQTKPHELHMFQCYQTVLAETS